MSWTVESYTHADLLLFINEYSNVCVFTWQESPINHLEARGRDSTKAEIFQRKPNGRASNQSDLLIVTESSFYWSISSSIKSLVVIAAIPNYRNSDRTPNWLIMMIHSKRS